jgi:CHRD domain
MRLRYTHALALVASLSLALAGAASATTFGYVAHLSGLNEVPPNGSPGSGTAFVTYDDVTNTITTSITFSGLVGTTTASHFHGPATTSTNAPVIHGFAATPLGVTSGSYGDVWTTATATQVGWLQTQQLYVNIHSQVYPGGEIRGQVVPDATPSRAVSLGRIKSLYR